MRRKLATAATPLILILAASYTLADSGESGEPGESGRQYGPADTAHETRNGVDLVMRYDAGQERFTGTLTNTNNATVTDVRVEVHLSNGIELGPTPRTSLTTGQVHPVELDATGQRFTTWSVHVELGSGSNGGGEHDGGDGGEHGGENGGGEGGEGDGGVEEDVCATDAQMLCLHGGRYQVGVEWSTDDGASGAGRRAAPATRDSGLFWFFAPDNWEMLIKVLDGCRHNGHHWVFAASATNLGLKLTVTDTETGKSKVYRKDPGEPAPAFTDVAAFPEACTP